LVFDTSLLHTSGKHKHTRRFKQSEFVREEETELASAKTIKLRIQWYTTKFQAFGLGNKNKL